MENKKNLAFLSYILILFLVPLIIDPKDEFLKFHAKQGIILLFFFIAVFVIGAIVPFIGWFFIWPLGIFAWIILAIFGIYNSLQGKKEYLPVIGKFADKLNI